MLTYSDLPKSDKRIIQELLNLGAQRMYRKGLKKAESIVEKWKKSIADEKSDEKFYSNLCKTIINHDKSISRTFDGLSGSRFVITVAGLFADDILKEDDLKGLTPDTYEFMLQFKHTME